MALLSLPFHVQFIKKYWWLFLPDISSTDIWNPTTFHHLYYCYLPWSNPSSSWTWNIIASWWIFLHPLLLYNLDKTNTQDKSCHFLCSTCSSGLLYYPGNIHSHYMLYLTPFHHLNCSNYSPLYTLSYIHTSYLKLTKHASTSDFTLAVLSTWNILPPVTHMIYCLPSCRFLLKCHLITGLLT